MGARVRSVAAGFVLVLLVAGDAAAAVNYVVRLVDPEADVHVSVNQSMGEASEGAKVDGHESVDITRVNSDLRDGVLTLSIDVLGNAGKENSYVFALQTTSSGRLWRDRDMVAVLHNGSATLYFTNNLTAHDLDRARTMDASAGGALNGKSVRLAVQSSVLGTVEHFNLEAYAFKPRGGNETGYFFDWTRNAQAITGDFWSSIVSSWGLMILFVIFIFAFFMLFRYRESLNRKAASRPCKACKKPVPRGLIFCPHCGKEVEYRPE